MINATDLKNGTTFILYAKPYQVIKYTHIKMGRGGAIVRVTARNLESRGIEEKTFSSDIAVDEAVTQKRKLQFLYKDNLKVFFMDTKTFEQIEIGFPVIKDELPYMKEGEDVSVLFWDEKPLSVEIPPKVVLKVKETPPGVKGNSATNIYKPAVLENGLKAKVPLFIKEGDKIRIDTRTGEYVERVK